MKKSTPRLCEGWDGCRRQTKEVSGMMKGSGGKPPPRFAAKSEGVGAGTIVVVSR